MVTPGERRKQRRELIKGEARDCTQRGEVYGRIFLRVGVERSPAIPYKLETDREDYVPRGELGSVMIHPPVKSHWVYGVSADGMAGLTSLVGIAHHEKELTQKVYDDCVEYGKTVARSLPDNFEFIDEVKDPVKIHMPCLG
jgi:hypothetical protein